MDRKIQNWAFVAPKMSRDLSEYFEGILDFIKDDPSVFLHAFTFADSNIATIADMDGVISYTVPPPEVMSVFKRPHPPIVAITMCKPSDPSICTAHIDPNGVAERVADLLARRSCRSYAFCSSHAPYFTDESTALLRAYRRQILAKTGLAPRLFRPISTLNVNLIESEVTRFTVWCAKVPKPCGMFVHGDDVARKMRGTSSTRSCSTAMRRRSATSPFISTFRSERSKTTSPPFTSTRSGTRSPPSGSTASATPFAPRTSRSRRSSPAFFHPPELDPLQYILEVNA